VRRAGFGLEELIELYTAQFSPLAYHQAKRAFRPLKEVYDYVMGLISGDAPSIKEHRKKMFGVDCFKNTPAEFSEMGMLAELRIPYSVWCEMDVDDKARFWAHRLVKSMMDVVERHYEIIEENMERALSAGKKR